MQLARVLVHWEAPQIVGDGVSVLHFDASDSDPVAGDIRGAFAELVTVLPTAVSITVPASGDVIDDATGNLVRSWTSVSTAPVVGSAPGQAAAGVGAVVTWDTGQIVRGRRLRGRTFVVPLAAGVYDLTGNINTGSLAIVKNFADALMTDNVLGVWSRPTTPGGSDGTSGGVVANRVRNRVAFLGSRRD